MQPVQHPREPSQPFTDRRAGARGGRLDDSLRLAPSAFASPSNTEPVCATKTCTRKISLAASRVSHRRRMRPATTLAVAGTSAFGPFAGGALSVLGTAVAASTATHACHRCRATDAGSIHQMRPHAAHAYAPPAPVRSSPLRTTRELSAPGSHAGAARRARTPGSTPVDSRRGSGAGSRARAPSSPAPRRRSRPSACTRGAG